MLEGGSPIITGFELTGRAPLDYKSAANSIEDMYTIRKKYEGMTVYIKYNSADDRTGKKYILKSLEEAGLSQATINAWGTQFEHWRLDGADTDLDGYTQNATADQTAIYTPSLEVSDQLDVDDNGQTTLGAALNRAFELIKNFTTGAIELADEVTGGLLKAVTSNAVYEALLSKADLDGNGKVPSSQLPSYVDDIIEYETYALMTALPGEGGKIYVVLDDPADSPSNKINGEYRWSGTQYTRIYDDMDLSAYTLNATAGTTALVTPESDVADLYVLSSGKGFLNDLFSRLSRYVKEIRTNLIFTYSSTTYFRLNRNRITIPSTSDAVQNWSVIPDFDRYDVVFAGADFEVTSITNTFIEGKQIEIVNKTAGATKVTFKHGSSFLLDGQIDLILGKDDFVIFEKYGTFLKQISAASYSPVDIEVPGTTGIQSINPGSDNVIIDATDPENIVISVEESGETIEKATTIDIVNEVEDKYPDAKAVENYGDILLNAAYSADALRLLSRIKGNTIYATYNAGTKTVTLPAFDDSEVNFVLIDMLAASAGTYDINYFSGGVNNRGFFIGILQSGSSVKMRFSAIGGNNLGVISSFSLGILSPGEARLIYKDNTTYILAYKVNSFDQNAFIPSLTGNGTKVLAAKADESGLEFITISAEPDGGDTVTTGSSVALTGTISTIQPIFVNGIQKGFLITGFSGANSSPVANAGPNKSLSSGTLLYQIPSGDASASDSDGSITSVAWTQDVGPNTATISNGNTLTPTFTNLISGSYTFRLTVTDDDSATGFDTMILAIGESVQEYFPIASGYFIGDTVIVTEQPSMSGYYIGDNIEVNQ